MKVIEINESEFSSKIKSGKVLVDCYADWCGPCKMLSPIIDEVAKDNNTCSFYKLNVDDNEKIAREYGIMSIPCIIYFKDGKEVSRSVGLVSKDDLLKIVGE